MIDQYNKGMNRDITSTFDTSGVLIETDFLNRNETNATNNNDI